MHFRHQVRFQLFGLSLAVSSAACSSGSQTAGGKPTVQAAQGDSAAQIKDNTTPSGALALTMPDLAGADTVELNFKSAAHGSKIHLTLPYSNVLSIAALPIDSYHVVLVVLDVKRQELYRGESDAGISPGANSMAIQLVKTGGTGSLDIKVLPPEEPAPSSILSTCDALKEVETQPLSTCPSDGDEGLVTCRLNMQRSDGDRMQYQSLTARGECSPSIAILKLSKLACDSHNDWQVVFASPYLTCQDQGGLPTDPEPSVPPAPAPQPVDAPQKPPQAPIAPTPPPARVPPPAPQPGLPHPQ